MEQGNSYRQILKWGDKREETVSRHMAEVIMERFGLSEQDFGQKHLPGTEPVKLEKPRKPLMNGLGVRAAEP